ncbi:MAG: L-fucose:H+ symporter permease [Bacteroidales bacterium]|nr:L-fucose:H+ symporter permease [Bacteroidales bacterium]MDO4999749.1 L-fucose:H+ symporter permease [Bacteroidales bacterium]
MKTIEKKYLLPFCLVTVLFLLWGLANNMTDTLLSAFKRIMSMSDAQTSLIQFAFYGSYFCFALPAALYIRKYSYKSGVILGLCLYAAGAILFFPASKTASYAFYLAAIYIMAGGCSILETTANPYILSMGAPQTATRRLNIAQSFNPLGSITGILLSQYFILGELSSASAAERAAMSPEKLEALQAHELGAVTGTYMTLGFVLLAIMVVMLLVRMPEGRDDGASDSLKETFRRLLSNKTYKWGVVAQFFYIGAQIGVWSFTIRLVMQELGILEARAATIYLVSIICFSAARFLFTWLMKWFRPSKLLLWAAVADIVLCALVVLCKGAGWLCVGALVGVSFFMSLMFPTIYGIALTDVGADAKIGASGLIMAILGGALLTPLQGRISDLFGVNASYLVPLGCFVVVLAYACFVVHNSVDKIS